MEIQDPELRVTMRGIIFHLIGEGESL